MSGKAVKYVDPDGEKILNAATFLQQSAGATAELGSEGSGELISDEGCVLTAYTRMASAILGSDISLITANEAAIKHYEDGNLLRQEGGAGLINDLLNGKGTVKFLGSIERNDPRFYPSILHVLEESKDDFFVTARISTTNADGTEIYEHTVNINSESLFINEDGKLDIRFNDTSGVRESLNDTERQNTILRLDVYKYEN